MKGLLFLMLALSPGLRAVVLDAFDYKDSAAIQKIWLPRGESKAAELTMGGDMVRAAKLPAHFSTLKEWRVFWDRAIKADLSQSEQITVKLKSPDPSAVGQVLLYFKSGAGWYRMPAFSVGPEWETKVLARDQAAAEETPAGWGKVDGIRICFMPAAKRDTYVLLAEIAGRSGWPLSHIGAMGGYRDFEDTDRGLRSRAKGKPAAQDVASRLNQARATALKAAGEQGGEARQKLILEGRALVAQAYALVQEPKEPEFRAVWVHHGDGLRGIGGERLVRWKEAIPALHAAGFNALVPNMLWSGTAYYPSSVVPVNPKVKAEGDYLQEIIDAAKPLGMKVHVWKVMWQFGEGWLAEDGVSEPFRKKGKLQLDFHGKEQPWLCPCDQSNREYELDALLEAAKYPVDGIHLDYIRFSGTEVSYSAMCRKRFEQSHAKVKNWPADCAPGGPRFDEYAEFKREVISSFVREASEKIKKAKPGIEVSAAVFSYASIARDSVSQDWPRWAREGWLDWISTMTYTEDAAGFRSAVAMQKEQMGGKTRLYPGMQVTFDAGRVVDLDTLVDEIRAVRELGLDGYTFFEYRDQLHDTVFPYLAAGLTRKGGYQLQLRPKAEAPQEIAPKKGQALKSAGPSLLIDDFEDGDLVNKLAGTWSGEVDAMNLGSTLIPSPLFAFKGGPGKSRFALGMTGHIGKLQAPWPYAFLRTAFNAASAPVDLTPYRALAFMARGDGKRYQAVLKQEAVKDSGDSRQGFAVGRGWTEVLLPLKNFNQPPWAKAVKREFADVKALLFMPEGLNDEDYELQVDNIRLLK